MHEPDQHSPQEDLASGSGRDPGSVWALPPQEEAPREPARAALRASGARGRLAGRVTRGAANIAAIGSLLAGGVAVVAYADDEGATQDGAAGTTQPAAEQPPAEEPAAEEPAAEEPAAEEPAVPAEEPAVEEPAAEAPAAEAPAEEPAAEEPAPADDPAPAADEQPAEATSGGAATVAPKPCPEGTTRIEGKKDDPATERREDCAVPGAPAPQDDPVADGGASKGTDAAATEDAPAASAPTEDTPVAPADDTTAAATTPPKGGSAATAAGDAPATPPATTPPAATEPSAGGIEDVTLPGAGEEQSALEDLESGLPETSSGSASADGPAGVGGPGGPGAPGDLGTGLPAADPTTDVGYPVEPLSPEDIAALQRYSPSEPPPVQLPDVRALTPAAAAALVEAASTTGVAWNVLAAIGQIESKSGRDAGEAFAGQRIGVRAKEPAKALPKVGAWLKANGGEAASADPWASEDALAAYFGDAEAGERATALAAYFYAVGVKGLERGLLAAQPDLERAVLGDRKIRIYGAGRKDIEQHRVDPRVLVSVRYLRARFGDVAVSSLITGHPFFSKSGQVSAHAFGRAVDVAELDHESVLGHQGAGTKSEEAVRLLLMLPGELAPRQIISLMDLDGPTANRGSFALADHDDHVHVGF